MQLSINRIALLSAVLVLLAVLCAASGAIVLVSSLGSGARQQVGESHVRLLSAQVAAQVAQYKNTARQLAAHAARSGTLGENKTAERTLFARHFAPALPQVLKLRLLPAGTRTTETGSVPELSYVCLDLLGRSEKGEAVPDAELHLPNTPSAHLDVLAPVTDSGKHVLGHVLLSLDPAAVGVTLAALSPEDGYAELRQINPNNEAMVVASGGNANLKSGAAPVAQDIAGTNWRLGLWPAAASGSSSIARLMLPGIAALLALVLLGLSVALPMLWLGDALRQDNKSFSTLFSDIRNGALMGQYPFRLKEFGHLAQALRSSGAEIIHDRHDLEKKAQLDNLTGLASRAAFDTKLKQLHQQARGGLASTLLIADIDNFKGVKAQLGPKACDALLKLFARQLREALRQSDVAARIENGKFAILFPFTGLDKIEPIADRLRARLAEEFDPGSNAPQAFSWSAGLTLVAQTDADTAASFTRAEAALKQAFTEGGNRTVTQAPPT